MKLAVNLLDLDRLDPLTRQILIAGRVDAGAMVMVGKEIAVPFSCDLLLAACLCQAVRNLDRRADRAPCRVYLKKADAWNKVPGIVDLITVEGGKCLLNPAAVPPEPVPTHAMPIPGRKVTVGRPLNGD